METLSLNPVREREAGENPPSAVGTNHALEASRYALLQRLAPAFRHKTAGAFQPVMMLASATKKLAQAPAVDLDKLRAQCDSLYEFSRSGASGSLEFFSWLSTAECVDIGINDGVRECLSLVATDLALREITIVNDLAMCTEIWPRDIFRHVFMAALLAITDAAPSPAKLVLSSELSADGLALALEMHTTSGAVLRESLPVYRKIAWPDVEVLAAAEGVGMVRLADGVKLSLLPCGD